MFIYYVYIYVDMFLLILGKYLGEEILEHMTNLCLTFQEIIKPFPK